MNNDYFQFNLDLNGHYIKGYLKSDLKDIFVIEHPETNIPTVNIQPNDNTLFLSKAAVVCYFRITK